MHALRNLVKLRRNGDKEALTVGLTHHHGLEAYYRKLQEHQQQYDWSQWDRWSQTKREEALWGNIQDAEVAGWEAVAPMEREPNYEKTWKMVEKLLNAYFHTYHRKDLWRVIAVEESLDYVDESFRYSARLDLVVEDFEQRGMWIVEHKSASTITDSLVSGYQLDQQILGQVWLMDRCVDLEAYPMFRGVKVNIITKAHTVPRCERVEVMPSRRHLVEFEGSIRSMNALEVAFAEQQWPKMLGNCAGATQFFSRCDYYDICYARPEATVVQLQHEDAPMGYYKLKGHE